MGPVAEFFLMQLLLIAVVLILHTYMGLHIIRRGIIFSDLVLDQLAAFGIVGGVALGIRYGTPLSYLCAFAAVLFGSVALAFTASGQSRVPREAAIGILYGMALIASLMLADKMRDGGVYFGKTLSGSMLWVSWPLVAVTGGVYLALGVLHYFVRKPILRLTESQEPSQGHRGWEFLFFLTQGIITILIVPVAGVLLAYGFLMIPAGIGTLCSRGWGSAMLIGWLGGLGACTLGVAGSYRYDLPYGPTLLLSMSLLFLLVLAVRMLRGMTMEISEEVS